MSIVKNTVQLIGRVGSIPNVKVFDNGVKCARFSLATNETVTDEKGKAIKTQWHQIVVWGRQVDLVEKYLSKGDLIAVEGKIVNRLFISHSGESQKKTEIEATEFLKINPRPTS